MEQQKIIDEINYYKAQAITELLYANRIILREVKFTKILQFEVSKIEKLEYQTGLKLLKLNTKRKRFSYSGKRLFLYSN